jgi:imidazolonepropionase-like amidohydrolase
MCSMRQPGVFSMPPFRNIALFVILALYLPAVPGLARDTPHGRLNRATGTILLDRISLIDGEGGMPRHDMSMLIVDGKIARIAASGDIKARPGWNVLRLPGRYVLPGLIDTHAHATFLRDPDRFSGHDRDVSERVLKILLAHGITTIRNPAAPEDEVVRLRERLNKGLTTGPQMLAAGRPINFGQDRSAEDVRREVRRQAETGIDYIKVYANMPPILIRAAVDEAHAHKLKVIGHLQASTPKAAVDAGIDAITHAATWTTSLLPENKRTLYESRRREVGAMRARMDWLEWLDGGSPEVLDSIRAVVESKTPLDPTLIAYATKFLGRDPRYRASPYLCIVPVEIRETWDGWLDNWPKEAFVQGRKSWPRLLELVKRYHDAGALLTTGSDFPNPYVIPGAGLHDEMALLVESGIPAGEVVRIATRNGAEALGLLEQVGTLTEGKYADLIVLGADPTADIENIRRIEIVFQAGRIFSPKKLLQRADVCSGAHGR